MFGNRTPTEFRSVFKLSCQGFGDEQSIPELIFGDDSLFHLPERLGSRNYGDFNSPVEGIVVSIPDRSPII